MKLLSCLLMPLMMMFTFCPAFAETKGNLESLLRFPSFAHRASGVAPLSRAMMDKMSGSPSFGGQVRISNLENTNDFKSQNIKIPDHQITQSPNHQIGTFPNNQQRTTSQIINHKSEILPNPFKFSGYYQDEESGMYYLNARYYSPELMRFISRDTYDLSNRYAYCDGNPVGNADPNGHCPEDIFGAAISLLFGEENVDMELAEDLAEFGRVTELFDPVFKAVAMATAETEGGDIAFNFAYEIKMKATEQGWISDDVYHAFLLGNEAAIRKAGKKTARAEVEKSFCRSEKFMQYLLSEKQKCYYKEDVWVRNYAGELGEKIGKQAGMWAYNSNRIGLRFAVNIIRNIAQLSCYMPVDSIVDVDAGLDVITWEDIPPGRVVCCHKNPNNTEGYMHPFEPESFIEYIKSDRRADFKWDHPFGCCPMCGVGQVREWALGITGIIH